MGEKNGLMGCLESEEENKHENLDEDKSKSGDAANPYASNSYGGATYSNTTQNQSAAASVNKTSSGVLFTKKMGRGSDGQIRGRIQRWEICRVCRKLHGNLRDHREW